MVDIFLGIYVLGTKFYVAVVALKWTMDGFLCISLHREVGVFLYIPLWYFFEVGGGGFLGTILWQSPVRKYCPAEASFTNCDVKTSSFYGMKLQLFLKKFTANKQIGLVVVVVNNLNFKLFF